MSDNQKQTADEWDRAEKLKHDLWMLSVAYGFKHEEADRIKRMEMCIDHLNQATLSAAKPDALEEWRTDFDDMPKEVDEYSGHGPYILIKTHELGHTEGLRIEKIHTVYWDEEVEHWQICTNGNQDFCALEYEIKAWKPCAALINAEASK